MGRPDFGTCFADPLPAQYAWPMSTPPIRFSTQACDALARDRLIEAIKHVRDDNDLSLRDAKQAVDAYLAGNRDFLFTDSASSMAPTAAGTGGVDDAETRVRQLLDQGLVIEAIKLVREVSGLGLKDAKDWVDARRINAALPLPARITVDAASPSPPPTLSAARRRHGSATVQRDRSGRWLAWLLPLLSLVCVLAWWLSRSS